MGRPPKELSEPLLILLKRIGKNLCAFRDERGISQVELSRKSGVSLPTLNEMETRRHRDLRLSTLAALAQALDVSVLDLLAESDLELKSKDRAQLLKATEEIWRITRKLSGP